LNSRDQKLTLGHLVEVREQNGLEEVQETEPVPEPKERAVAVFKLRKDLDPLRLRCSRTLRPALFWEFRQCGLLIPYRYFGTICRSQVSSFCLDFLTLEDCYGTTALLYMHARSFRISGMTAAFPRAY